MFAFGSVEVEMLSLEIYILLAQYLWPELPARLLEDAVTTSWCVVE